MLYKCVIISFLLCVVSTFCMLSINRPGSSLFLPSMVLQILSFLIIILFVFLFNRIGNVSIPVNYFISFISSYIILMIVIWKINGSNFLGFIIKYHKGKDFWSIVVPFIVSNLLMITFLILKKRRLFG